MKRLLFLLFFALTLNLFAQDTKPTNPEFKMLQAPNTPIFWYNPIDSFVWVYKGTYGWTRLLGETRAAYKYVPYNGATKQVDLGYQRITSKKQLLPLFNGACSIPTILDNGDGSITVGDGEYHLSTQTNGKGTESFLISGGVFTLTDNAMNYIVADYNSGTPIIKMISDVNLINETTVIPIYSAYRSGTTLHFQNWDALGVALANKVHQSIVKTQRYRRESGLGISEFPTRYLSIGNGKVWVGAVPVTLDAITTNTDNLRLFYHSGGVWTVSFQSQYNNTQYDDGTNLVTLTANRYAVNWLFRGVESQKHLYVVLGRGDYTLTQAQEATVPAIPDVISSHAALIGKIIIQKGATTATSIQSAFDVQFSASTPSAHNDLTGRDVADVHPAGSITVTPTGSISSTTVAAALSELDTEKLPLANISGTSGYLSKFTGTNTLGNSIAYSNGTNFAIGTTDMTYPFRINSGNKLSFHIEQSLSGSNGYDAIIGRANAFSTSQARLSVRDSVDVSIAGYHGIGDYSTITTSGIAGGYASFDALPQIIGTHDILHYNGIQIRPQYKNLGNVTQYMAGVWVQPTFVTTGNIIENYGAWILDPSISGGGSITRNYGIKIANQTVGVNNWALYSEGGQSYFAGNVGILAETPDTKLSVGTLPTSSFNTPDAAAFRGNSDSDNIISIGRGNVSAPQTIHFGAYQANEYSTIQSVKEGSRNTNLIINKDGGNVILGTSSDNGLDKLQVNGGAYLNGTINTTGYLLNGINLHSSLNPSYLSSWDGTRFVNSGVTWSNYIMTINGGTGDLNPTYSPIINLKRTSSTGNVFSSKIILNSNTTNSDWQQLLKIQVKSIASAGENDAFYSDAYSVITNGSGGISQYFPSGTVSINTLSGTGTRLTTASSDGTLGAITNASGFLKNDGSGGFSYITDNSTNWNTAYSWGNHASAGYATTSYVNSNFDNYSRWIIAAGGASAYVYSNNSVSFVNGSGVSFSVLSGSGSYSVTPNLDIYNLTTIVNPSLSGFLPYTTTGTNAKITLSTLQTTIGSTAGTANLNVIRDSSGDAYAHNFILSSDRRLKKNIIDLPNTDWTNKIEFKQFQFKGDPNNKTRYGVIAQDIEKIAPQLVSTDTSGNKAVSYIDLLIAKIAEMDKKIQSLEKRLQEVEK